MQNGEGVAAHSNMLVADADLTSVVVLFSFNFMLLVQRGQVILFTMLHNGVAFLHCVPISVCVQEIRGGTI